MFKVKRGLTPLQYFLVAGFGFFGATEAVLVLPILAAGEQPLWLSATDTIALLTGSITAAALAAVYAQLKEGERAAEERSREGRRQDALRLDSFHAHFGSLEVRSQRNLAYPYLKFLCADADRLRDYAAYWVNGFAHAVAIPSVEDMQRIFKAPDRDAGNAYDRWAGQKFEDYDMAVSAMVSFFSRLAMEVRQTSAVAPAAQLREAVGPFFWDSYWRPVLLDLADACALAAQELEIQKPPPYFVKALKDFDVALGCKAADDMSRDVTELVRLVRESERYCTSVAARPELATAESGQTEVQREHRIAELSRHLGVTA